MSETIRAINYKVDEVGKYMKGSKKRFQWSVGLNNRTHTIILDFSFISGKVKVIVDGRTLLENEIPINTSFQYPFNLDGFALNLIQQGQNCELRINNKVFSHLYTQQKTMQQFKKDDSQFGISISSEFMNKINSDNKKITLDLGNNKKNFVKKPKDQQDDWGVFDSFGLPPGFEQPPQMANFGKQFSVSTNNPSKVNQQIDFFQDSNENSNVKPVQIVQQQKKQEIDMFQDVKQQKKTSPPPTSIDITALYNKPTANNYGTNSQIQNTDIFGMNSQPSNINVGSNIYNTNPSTNQYFNTSVNQNSYMNQNNMYNTSQINYNQGTSFNPLQSNIQGGTAFNPLQSNIQAPTSFNPLQSNIQASTSFNPLQSNIQGGISFNPLQSNIQINQQNQQTNAYNFQTGINLGTTQQFGTINQQIPYQTSSNLNMNTFYQTQQLQNNNNANTIFFNETNNVNIDKNQQASIINQKLEKNLNIDDFLGLNSGASKIENSTTGPVQGNFATNVNYGSQIQSSNFNTMQVKKQQDLQFDLI